MVKLLAIDTSTSSLGAALGEDGRVIGEFSLQTGRNHSAGLLPMLEALLMHSGLTLAELDALAVTIGPGSFTGLRIGLATVKAWVQALDKPLLAVSTPEALAWQAAEADGYFCPLFDARRDEVYTALFAGRQRLWPDQALTPAALTARLQALDGSILLAGDGLPLYGAALLAELPKARLAPPGRACFLALGALEKAFALYAAGEFADPVALEPCYLRRSEAEEKKLAAERSG